VKRCSHALSDAEGPGAEKLEPAQVSRLEGVSSEQPLVRPSVPHRRSHAPSIASGNVSPHHMMPMTCAARTGGNQRKISTFAMPDHPGVRGLACRARSGHVLRTPGFCVLAGRVAYSRAGFGVDQQVGRLEVPSSRLQVGRTRPRLVSPSLAGGAGPRRRNPSLARPSSARSGAPPQPLRERRLRVLCLAYPKGARNVRAAS
jgi:hypothetical protein